MHFHKHSGEILSAIRENASDCIIDKAFIVMLSCTCNITDESYLLLA